MEESLIPVRHGFQDLPENGADEHGSEGGEDKPPGLLTRESPN